MDGAMKRMGQIKDLVVHKPDGAFYFWINVEKFLGRKYKGEAVNSSAQFGKIYLEDFHVATVPGEEFGEPGYIRLSFATQSEKFNEAMDRMQKFIDQMM